MKVQELIDELTQFGKRYGMGKKVVISVDTEGNSYSTLEHNDCLTIVDENKRVLGCCLFPFAEGFANAVEACKHKDVEVR